MDDLLTLEALSKRLGGIPISTLKHRIQQLGVPAAARGSRNKLLFDERAVTLLAAADELMKEGHGIHTTRRLLKLDQLQPEEEVPAEEAIEAPAAIEISLQKLADALADALGQLEAKDRLVLQLQEELRRASEASATFQQKTFYLQSELQRLQGELKDVKQPQGKEQGAWQKLWRRDQGGNG